MTNEQLEKIEEQWDENVKILEGKTIKTARYMTHDEAEMHDWHKRGLVLFFVDGTHMVLSQDDEGNGPGSAFTDIAELEVIPTL